jgi:hypothetical protein
MLDPRLCTQVLMEVNKDKSRKITFMEEQWVCMDCDFTKSVPDGISTYQEAAKILKTLPWENKP